MHTSHNQKIYQVLWIIITLLFWFLILTLLQELYYLLSSSSTSGINSTPLLSISIALSTLTVFMTGPLHPRAHRTHRGSISDAVLEPPIVRSWLPWIGQGIQFLKYPATFLPNCSLRYGTTFKFQLFGHYMIALSSPAAVSNFLRDRSGTFTVINFQQTHEFCGIGGGEKHYAYLYSVLERKLAPTATRCLSRRFLNNIIPTLISRLLEDVTKMVHDDTRSLHELVHRILYHSATAALFGPLFPVETYSDFMEYDEGVGFIAKYLPGLAPKSVEARSHLVAAYSRYFNAAWRDETGGFLEGASDVMSEMYRELRATELSYDEAARLMVHVTWAFNVNIMRVTTWVMCHILTDKDVYDRVCEEIRTFVDAHFPNFAGLESMDFKTLDDGQFQLLSSITQEVLRTKSSNVSMREATQDTVIMDENDVAILVRKGEYVMADMQSMHNSENLQRDPGQFQADRFLEKPSYKSVVFGAGQHMCAGRHYANFLIRMFVVATLSLYDISLDGIPSPSSSNLPTIDTHPFSVLSFFRPQQDLNLRIHRRKLE